MEFCVTCESFNSNDINCGECCPCRALISALVNIYIDTIEKDEEDIKDAAYEILKSRFDFKWEISIRKKPRVKTIIIGNTKIEEENLTDEN